MISVLRTYRFIEVYRTANVNKSLCYFSTKIVKVRNMANISGNLVNSGFPTSSLVPKAETGVTNFLSKYPEYNGKDVTIAIFDSGVDPKGQGLKKICDGSVKVVERFDCSGCGDTDTSTIATASAEGTINGLSRRTLQLTPEMISSNKNGNDFRVGLKSITDLFPSKIREQVLLKIKEKVWNAEQKKALADVSRKIANFEAKNCDPTTLSPKDKLVKEDLDGYLDFLNNYEKKYPNILTSYDCVVYETADGWQAVIDTTETGDLKNAVYIGEYSKTYEIKNINENFSISVNVHDEGNVLEIVGLCSSHGTHVASIASANTNGTDDDGVAPNAKIMSFTIGEGRLGSMETGTALVRAMIKVMQLCNSGRKIDVINMSYGEHAHWSDDGRIGELMCEIVNKYGVVWVASAGNHGPALSTIGTPPDLKELCCIGVGAYVSPQMMEGEYALREKLPANVYTWTSRDPCIDGGNAITVCAPGAAITSVPEYTMSRSMLMNGTSMSAPHVAGAIALLISGLKQKGIKYSPYSIKRALKATATKLDNVDQFAQGSGLLNVEKAFDHLVNYANQPENQLRFIVGVGKSMKKGIHLRSGVQTKPVECTINVEPIFQDNENVDIKEKVNFNLRLTLVSSQPWVKVGSYLDLCYMARSLSAVVNPVGLPVGVHSAVIKAYDSNCIEKGAVFEIPVTVVQPHVFDSNLSTTFRPQSPKEFRPNTIQREFILIPPNATWAVLRMRAVNDVENQEGKFYVHTMQLLPQTYCKGMETQKLLNVKDGNEVVHPFCCRENTVLEVCIAKYWSNIGTTSLQYSVEFKGIRPTGPLSYTMFHTEGVHSFIVTSLGSEDANPSVTLKTAVVPLKPTEAKISPLSEGRDVIPEGRQIYQNILTYSLHLTKAQEINLHTSIISATLYEGLYESQLWMLFDSNKMLVACGDAFSSNTSHKLEKGDYTIRLQVRHEKKEHLEKLSELIMLASFKLASPLTVDVYDHYNLAIIGGKKAATATIQGSCDTKKYYLAALSTEKLTKANLPSGCTYLNGNVVLTKDEFGRTVTSSLFSYVVSDTLVNSSKKNGNGNGGNSASSNGNGSSPTKSKTPFDDYKDGIRDYQCSMIPKLERFQVEEVYNEVIAAHPKHLLAHMMLIQSLEASLNLKMIYPMGFAKAVKEPTDLDLPKLSNVLKRTIELTDLIINETDKDALLAYYGMKADSRSDAAKIKTSMEKQKNLLLEAYVKNGIAKCKMALIEQEENAETQSIISSSLVQQIDGIYTEISKYIDNTDTKVVLFTIWHAYTNNQYGRMAKHLQKIYLEKLNKDVLDELSLIAASKDWNHVNTLINQQIVTGNPGAFRLF